MSLQVRLRHALGERLIELPDRAVDEPVVVGRSSAADVQVPSVTVSQRHCVLFVHEGRWAIQEVSGNAGTFVNGRKVEGPTPLRVGDLVTLGPEPSAPNLEIDPAGAARGRTGQPASSGGAVPFSQAPAPTAPAAPVTPAQALQAAYPAPGAAAGAAYGAGYGAEATYGAGVGYGHPVVAPAGAMEVPASPVASTAWGSVPVGADDAGATGPGDTIAWPTDAGHPPRYHTRRRPRRSDSSTPIAVLLTLIIVGGVGYYVYKHRPPATQVALPSAPSNPNPNSAPSTRRQDDPSQMPPSIFDKTDPRRIGRPPKPPGTRPASGPALGAGATAGADTRPGNPDMTGADASVGMESSAVAAAPDSGSADVSTPTGQDAADAADAAPDAAAEADPAWKQVLAARFSRDEAKAILKFDDYAQSHPGRFTTQLAEYTDKAMERIWFERLEQLCKQREELAQKIKQTEKETAEETDEAYKERVLIPLKQQYTNRLQTVQEELKDSMKYDAATPPNLLDEAQLEKLRRQRDPAQYAGWKNRVLAHIRRRHGELPWTTDKSS